MPDTDFDAVNDGTWASASQQADVPTAILPEFNDDTIFRATQRIPRIVDALAPAHAYDLSDPPLRRLAPEASGPERRTMVLVLLVAVASLATLIAWPLLDRRPSVPAAAPPLPSATLTVITPAATPLPTASTTTVTTRPLPPPAVPVPAKTVTTVVTVQVTPPPPSTTPAESPGASVSPSASPTPTTPTPTSSPTPFPISTWSFTTAGLGPVLLGTTTASALAAGYLVADAAAPSGYTTAPALSSGVRLTVTNGVISAISIVDAGVRSPEGAGVGTPITTLSTAYGTALVSLTAKDAAGDPLSVPGLKGPAGYIAFLPTTGVVSTVVVGNTQPDGTIVLP